MTRGNDVSSDEEEHERGRDASYDAVIETYRIATIASGDGTVTFAEPDGLGQGGTTTAWISIDAEHVVDARERQ